MPIVPPIISSLGSEEEDKKKQVPVNPAANLQVPQAPAEEPGIIATLASAPETIKRNYEETKRIFQETEGQDFWDRAKALTIDRAPAPEEEQLADALTPGSPDLAKGVTKGFLDIGSSLGTLIEYTGGKLDDNDLIDFGNSVTDAFNKVGKRFEPKPELQGSVFDNPELLTKGAWWMYNTGTIIPSLLPSIGSGYGAAKLIDIGGRALKWSPALITKLARIGAALTGGAVGGAQEGANTYEEVLARGGSREEAEASGEMMTLASAALNALSIDRWLAKLPDGAKNRLIARGTRGLIEGLTEWLEGPAEAGIMLHEANQEGSQLKFTPEQAIQKIKDELNVLGPSILTGLFMPGAGAVGEMQKENAGPISSAANMVTGKLMPLSQDGAMRRAETLSLQGVPHGVVPHPQARGKYAVVPIDNALLQEQKANEPAEDTIEIDHHTIAAEMADENRRALALRKSIDAMSPEEQKAAIADLRKMTFTSRLTGLQNKDAFTELYGESFDKPGRPSHILMIDSDSLKTVNDTMGHGAGDTLLRLTGMALKASAANLDPDSSSGSYHFSGDEFGLTGNDPAMLEKIAKGAQDILKQATITGETPDGRMARLSGLGFSYGLGTNLQEADHALIQNKTAREAAGERAARGEQPSGLLINDRQEQAAEGIGSASIASEVDAAAHEAATSPLNARPEPTEAQQAAGNYKKGHYTLQGLNLTIENPQGSVRSGVTKEGQKWETQLANHYGYIKRTEGADGDQVDTFVGPNPESQNVFIVNQIDPTTGAFDEHKVMLGFDSAKEAEDAYHANYQQGWEGMGTIEEMPMDEFKQWLKEGDTAAPFTRGGLNKFDATLKADVSYKRVQTAVMRSGITKVKTPNDAAHVLNSIRKLANEEFYAMVLDRNGKILDIQRHSIGTKDGASVFPPSVGPAIARVPKAAQVYFSHNHPSGEPSPSRADQAITDTLKRFLDGSGIKVAGHVIIGSTNKAHAFLDDEGYPMEVLPRVRKHAIPVTESRLRKVQTTKGPAITSPSDGQSMVKNIEAKNAIVLLDNRHRQIGVLEMTKEEMAQLRKGAAREVLAAIDETNAAAAIVKTEDRETANNITRYLKSGEKVRLLDVFVPNKLGIHESYAEQGIMDNAGTFNNRAGKYNFRDTVQRTGEGVTIMAEAIPSDKVAPELLSLPVDKAIEFTEKSYALIHGKDGQNLLTQLLGLKGASTTLSEGAYAGGVHPNLVVELDNAFQNESAANLYAMALQYIYSQDSVVVQHAVLNPSNTTNLSRGYYITFKDDLNPASEQAILEAFNRIVSDGVGFTRVGPREIMVVNIADYTGLDNAAFEAAMKGAINDQHEALGIVDAHNYWAKLNFNDSEAHHDWQADPEGQAILEKIQAGLPNQGSWAGPSGVQARLRGWREGHQALIERYRKDGAVTYASERKFSDRYGYIDKMLRSVKWGVPTTDYSTLTENDSRPFLRFYAKTDFKAKVFTEEGITDSYRSSDVTERPVINAALADLIDSGLPANALMMVKDIGTFDVNDQHPTTAQFVTPSVVGGKKFERGIWVNVNTIEGIQEGDQKLAAALRSDLAHEIGHAIDIGSTEESDSHTWGSRLFRIDPLKIAAVADPTSPVGARLDHKGGLGPIMQEVVDFHLSKEAVETGLHDMLHYPLYDLYRNVARGKKFELPNGDVITVEADLEKKNPLLAQFISFEVEGQIMRVQAETFAQLHAIFYTAPEVMAKHLPKSYALMQEVQDAVRKSADSVSLDGSLRKVLRTPGTRLRPYWVQRGLFESKTGRGGKERPAGAGVGAGVEAQRGAAPQHAATATPYGRRGRGNQNWKTQDVSNNPAFKQWFGDSKVVDEDGKPLVVYHGTTHDFDQFSTVYTNPENYMGVGFYFSNEIDDVNKNYAGFGPDLKMRIEREMERIDDNDVLIDILSEERSLDYDEAREVFENLSSSDVERLTRKAAAEILGVENRGAVMPVFLRMENPVVIDRHNGTVLTSEWDRDYYLDIARGEVSEEDHLDADGVLDEDSYNDALDEKAREIFYDDFSPALTGTAPNLYEALREAADYYGVDGYELANKAREEFGYEDTNVKAGDFVEWMQSREELYDAYDEEGNTAANEVIRMAFEKMGFDGVIMDANDAFGAGRIMRMGNGAMDGIYGDTKHYIAFTPDQIKSAIGNKGTYSPSPSILMSPKGKGFGRTAEAVQADVNELSKTHKAGPKLAVVSTRQMLPKRLYDASMRLRGKPEAVFDAETNSLYFIADNLPTKEDVQRVMLHEMFGHWAPESAYGKEFEPLLDLVINSYGDKLKGIADMHGVDFDTRTGKLIAAKEQIAEIAETGINPTLFNKLSMMLKRILHNLGFRVKLSDGDIRAILASTGKLVYEGDAIFTGKGGAPLFSQQSPDWYYSQMSEHLAQKLPEKGQAGQLRIMINNMAAKGQFKSEELAWSGLDEWLANQEGSVTKNEILDYIDNNNVQLEEKILGEGFDGEAISSDDVTYGELRTEEISDDALDDEIEYQRSQLEENGVINKEDYTDEDGNFDEDKYNDDLDQWARDSAWDSLLETAYSSASNDWGYEIVYDPMNRTYMARTPDGEIFADNGEKYPERVYQQIEDRMRADGFNIVSEEQREEEGTQYEKYTEDGTKKDYRELLIKLPRKSKYVTVEDPGYGQLSFPNPEQASKFIEEFKNEGYITKYGLTTGSPVQVALSREGSSLVLWGIGDPEYVLDFEPYHQMLNSIAKKYGGEMFFGHHEVNTAKGYSSPHFDYHSENLLAHARFDERKDENGRRVLFIEEIQSDWHQAGRDRGYSSPSFIVMSHGTQVLKDGNPAIFKTREEAAAYIKERGKQGEWKIRAGDGGAIADAPFKKTWPLLVFKRIIRYAAENGFDRISWTTGAMQNNRYNLSKFVTRIEVRPDPLLSNEYRMVAYYGERIVFPQSGHGFAVMEKEKIADYVGKEMAKDIFQKLDNGHKEVVIEGKDLEIGGDGMKGFYDNILPKEIGKYVKRWGAEVGANKITLRTLPFQYKIEKIMHGQFPYEAEGAYRILVPHQSVLGAWSPMVRAPYFESAERAEEWLHKNGYIDPEVWGVDVTPAMRSDAMLGQPLFSQTPQQATQSIKDMWYRKADKVLNAMNRYLSPIGTLPRGEEYLGTRQKTMGRIAKVDQAVSRIHTLFNHAKLTPEEMGNIYAYFTTRDADPSTIPDRPVTVNRSRGTGRFFQTEQEKSLRREIMAIKRLIRETGQELVRHNLIPQESFEHYADRYLPRLYLAHLLDDQTFRSITTGKKVSQLGYTKHRDEDMPALTRIIMGEIKNPGYLAAKTVGTTLRDVAILDFLAEVSKVEEWTLPQYITDYNGHRVTAEWLISEGERIISRSAYQTDEVMMSDAAISRAMGADMIAKGQQMLAEAGKADVDYKDFRQVPNTPRYGALRGAWIRKEIYNDLIGGIGAVRGESFFENLLGSGGIGTKATQLWKMSKVALNPPSQVRNFLSNMILVNIDGGVPLHQIPGLFHRAFGEVRRNGQYWRLAQREGVTNSTFASNELFRLDRELLKMKKQAGQLGMFEHMLLAGSYIGEIASDAYQFSEAISKTMMMIHGIEKLGMTPEQAARLANRTLFDYSHVGPNVRYLRNAPIGAPFVTFYYKVLPRMADVAMKHPQRLLPYMLVPYLISQAIANSLDVDDDDLEKLKMALPNWIRERGHSMILPYKDDNGRWQAFDYGYFLPWGMFTDVAGDLAKGELGDAVKTSGIFGGPISELLVAIKTGKDSFTGKPIFYDADPATQQAKDIMNYLWRMSMPTWLTDIGAVAHTYRAVTGHVDPRTGEPTATLGQALMRFFGMNIYPVDPEFSRAMNLMQYKYELNEIKARMRKRASDQNLTDTERREIITAYSKLLERKAEELRKYAKDSEVNPKLRTGKPENEQPTTGSPMMK